MRRLVLIAVTATSLAVGAVVPSSARGQAPVVVDVPPAELCQGPPQRSVAPLFASPAAGTPTASAMPFAMPTGQPADAAAAAAMTAAMRAVIACINTGQYFPVLTLVSDDYLRERFVPGAPTDPLSEELRPFVEALRGCQTCELEPLADDERFGIVAVEQARLLDDGRVGAVVRLSTPAAAEAGILLTAFVAFVSVEDRLLVDEIVELTE